MKNQYTSVHVDNGSFAFSVLNCPSLTTFSLEGIDANTIEFTLTNYGAIGDYTDNMGVVKSITGTLHVIRDN